MELGACQDSADSRNPSNSMFGVFLNRFFALYHKVSMFTERAAFSATISSSVIPIRHR